MVPEKNSKMLLFRFSYMAADYDQHTIYTVAEVLDDIENANGTRVKPDYDYNTCLQMSVLIVPGGKGSRNERYNKATQNFIKNRYESLKYLISVCTGSLILAEAGMLNSKNATTHYNAIDILEAYKEVHVVKDVRYTHDGNIITSAGIMAGIDASLYLLEIIYPENGKMISCEVKKHLTYPGIENR